MKTLYSYFRFFILTFFIVFYACFKDSDDLPSINNDDDIDIVTNAPFGSVFFGQTHIKQPEDDGFKLISGKALLLKVNLIKGIGNNAPDIKATVTVNGMMETITLTGPAIVPEAIDLRKGFINHNFEDSYTAMISKDLVQSGINILIEVGDESVIFNNLNVGAPNKIIMNMFDVHFFEETSGDYATGWKEELESKLPTSEIELIRLPNIIFSELTIPARANVPAARVSSMQDYQDITGISFDGEQAAASQWNGALKRAAGIKGRYSLFYTNIYGVASGGQAGGYGGVGNGKSLGILNHELGHALSLPHWGDKPEYPYRDEMFGIPAPEVYNGVHVGPVWAFDLAKNKFIPPTVQVNSVGGETGTYKKDPMQGGGAGDQEEGFLLRHFSDYSINKTQNYLENHIVIRNTDGTYVSWDVATGDYSKSMSNNGVEFAVENDINVISVMAGVSAVTTQATILYPPIGPYRSGIIDLFNPNDAADRASAAAIYCPNGGCDVSLRVVQGGQTKLFMLPIEMDEAANPLDGNSFITRAINLKASDGNVTSVDLLLTPNAEIDGITNNPEILYSWNN